MQLVTGSLSSVGMGNIFIPIPLQNGPNPGITNPAQFNIAVSGTFSATWQILRSIDNGVTYSPLSSLGTTYNFSSSMNESFSEPQSSTRYAIAIIAYTSGTLNYALAQ
jgi:hypothetical protein